MVNHTLRFRLGGMLTALGLILAVIEGIFWVYRGAPLYGLLTLLGIVLLASGLRLLRHKRSL